MRLAFKINGQRVSMLAPDMVSDTIGYFDAKCTFTQDWDGTNKWMHLISPLGEKTDFRLEDDMVSGLNLTEGRWEVWFHGNEMTAGVISTRVVTQTISFVVSSSGVGPEGPLAKIPLSAAEQISANAAEALRMAQLLQKEYDTLKRDAETSAKLSQSWAVGGTETRSDEDTNNSKYFCEKAESDAKTATDAATAAELSKAAVEASKTEAAESAAASKASELLADEARKAAEASRKAIEKMNVIATAPDYAQNDPAKPGYIANRPCYFTGATKEETVLEAQPVPVGDSPEPYSGAQMTAGEDYRMTINGVSVEMQAYTQTVGEITGVAVGDSFVDFMAGGGFVPTCGYLLGMLATSGQSAIALIPTDGTGEMLMAAFGLSPEDLAAGTVPVTLAHIVREAVKLDKRLLPDDIGSQIKVVDIGSGDATNIDFSAYKAGDIILVVGNM